MTGRQEPTFEVVGEWDETNGSEAVSLFEDYGFCFDRAQRHEMDVYLARTCGRPSAISIGLSVPRQNGKSYAARWYAIWCAAVLGLIVLYSAHNGDTISEFFSMITSVFEDDENYPDFAEMLDGAPYRQPGKESVRFRSGGRIRFMTRTNNKSRSSTCDILVMDEAQELTDAQLNAILPVVSAGPHGMPQTIYIGTPPDPTCHGTVFRRMHDKAHSSDPGSGWWMEWAVGELPPEDATSDQLMELAYMTNPALGVRITEEAVANEIDKMTRDGFARERLGWWDRNLSHVEHVIDAEAWALCETEDPPTEGLMCAGVKFAQDRATLAACVRPKDGPAYVEWVDTRPLSEGVGWVAQWICARRDRVASVAMDGPSGTGALATRLADEGFPKTAVVVARPSDMARAVSMLASDVAERNVTHYGQEELTASATRTARRAIGRDGIGFEDADGADATLIEACCLALWQARTTKRRPGRRAVVY